MEALRRLTQEFCPTLQIRQISPRLIIISIHRSMKQFLKRQRFSLLQRMGTAIFQWQKSPAPRPKIGLQQECNSFPADGKNASLGGEYVEPSLIGIIIMSYLPIVNHFRTSYLIRIDRVVVKTFAEVEIGCRKYYFKK